LFDYAFAPANARLERLAEHRNQCGFAKELAGRRGRVHHLAGINRDRGGAAPDCAEFLVTPACQSENAGSSLSSASAD
jgi:hypothetical protein